MGNDRSAMLALKEDLIRGKSYTGGPGKAARKRKFGGRRERKGSLPGNKMGKSYSMPTLLNLKK